MPRIAIPEEIGRRMAEKGLDPSNYELDTDQRTLVLKESLGPVGGALEVGKSLLRGGVGGLSRAAQFGGGLLKSAGELLPDAGLLEQRGREMEAIAGGARGATDATFKPKAAVGNLPEWAQMGLVDVPETLGQVGGTVGSSLLAGPFAPLAAMALGGAAEAQDAREAELARQRRVGAPTDEDFAKFKGVLYGVPAAGIEAFGGGRIAKKLIGEGVEQAAKRGLLRRLATNTAVGSGEEAAQQSLQDLIVEGQIDPANVGRAALLGGIVQGPLATAAESRAMKNLPPVLEQKQDAVEGMTAGIEGIKEAVDEANNPNEAPANEVAAFLATQDNNKTEWGVVGEERPYDNALKKALSNGIKLTESQVREIMSAEEPDLALRKISADWQLLEANRPETLKESLDRKLEREKQMADLEKRRDGLMSRVEQIEDRLRKVTLSQSERWRVNEKLKWLKEQVSKADSAIAELEAADIEPQMAVGRPESPGFYSGESAGTATPRNRPLQPTVTPAGAPLQQETLQDKAGTILQEQIAAQRGNVPPSNVGIAEAEKQLTDYRASTEGEKSVPFGEVVPGSLTTTPVPESAQQIAVQLQLTADPASSKAATLITPGAPLPEIPNGLQSTLTPHGTVVFNPAKISLAQVKQASAGEVFDGSILGMSGNAPASSDIAVTTSTADTPDVVSELVAPEPAAIQQAAAAQQAAVPGGTQQVKSAAEMLDDRQNDDTKIYGFGLGGLADANNDTAYLDIRFFGPGDLFGRLAKGGLLEKATRVALSPLRLINSVTRDELTSLAKRSPTYAYFMYKWPALVRERQQLFNRAVKATLSLKDALTNPKIINLLHENATAGKVSYAGLSSAEVAQLHAVYKLIKAFHAIQRAFGVHVKDMDAAGNIFYRPPRDNDAYAIFSIDSKVWDAMKMGGKEWEAYKKDWLENWKKHRGGSKNWKQEALAALEDFQKPLAEMQARGGEPMFNAVRLRAGIPLPKSWRSTDLVGSILNYADRWAMDLAWAKIVQNNPILRTAFGIKRDSKGNEVENPETFKGFGSAVAEANREGKLRADADWVADENTAIDVLADGPAIDAIVHSFARRPMTRQNTKSYQMLEAFNHLAANTIMGPKSALRDFASAATIVNDYLSFKDTKQLLGSIGRYLRNPNDARLAAEAAGSQSMDTFTHEFGQDPGLAKRAHGVAYRAAYFMRQAQGRGIADTYGKALDYQVAYDTIVERLRNGQSHPLVDEFGPADWRKMNPEEVAADVASRVVERVNPRYDIGSLPTWLIPQNRGFRSLALALMRWSVGRYNKWYQDAVIPLYKGDPRRFIKSLFNGVVGAAAAQALISYLEDKKPEELTWTEFLHLPKDKQSADKVFNIIFGYLQAQGTMGVLGDIGYQATKAATGRPIKAPDINPVYPAAILATDFANIIGQFLLNNPDGIQAQELGELALELGRLSQSYRFVADRFDDERKSNREKRQFQQLYGRSPITAEAVSEPSGLMGSFKRQPWTLSKSLQKAESPEDFRRLAKTFAQRAARGLQPPTVERELMHPVFYADLARRRGREAMQEQLRADLEREQAAKRRRAFSAMFR